MPACADNPERCLKGQHSHAHPLTLHPRSLPQALSSQCPAIALRASDQSRLADHSSFATRRICTLFAGGARQSRTWRALPTVVSHAAEDASGDASEAMVRSPIPAMVAQNSQGDDHVSPHTRAAGGVAQDTTRASTVLSIEERPWSALRSCLPHEPEVAWGGSCSL